MKQYLWACSVIAALAAGAGCGDKESKAKAGADQAGSAKTPDKADDAEQRAVGLIVEGYNELIAEVDRNITRNYAPSAAPPAADQLDQVRLSTLHANHDRALAEATKKFGEAKQLAPALPVTAAAEDMGTAAAALGEAYRAVARYYEADEYKGDGGAKVAELHAGFMTRFEAYAAAQGQVADALDAREQAELAEELSQFAPTTASYWFRKTLMDAKVLVAAAGQLGDRAQFTAANQAFQKTAAELDAFATSQGAAINASFNALRRGAVENLATRAAKVARALEDKEPNQGLLDADLDTMVQYYNHLVQSANSLFELEASGALK